MGNKISVSEIEQVIERRTAALIKALKTEMSAQLQNHFVNTISRLKALVESSEYRCEDTLKEIEKLRRIPFSQKVSIPEDTIDRLKAHASKESITKEMAGVSVATVGMVLALVLVIGIMLVLIGLVVIYYRKSVEAEKQRDVRFKREARRDKKLPSILYNPPLALPSSESPDRQSSESLQSNKTIYERNIR
nr:MAG: hypothetical protein [Dicrocoelium Rhabdo-like virus 1]